METKKHIRKEVLALRDNMSLEERSIKSREIINRLISLKQYKAAEGIAVYVNFRSEVITEELLEKAFLDGKLVYCPKTGRTELEFYRIDNIGDLAESYMGIREPKAEQSRLLTKEMICTNKCLMLMPGSAFDRNRNRMGYGRGYYDRYLAEYPYFSTAALCFDCQLIEKVPFDDKDKRPDCIITEYEII